MYDENLSSSYQPASNKMSENNFADLYLDGESVAGEHAKDVLHLSGGLDIEDQIFAQITSFHEFKNCAGEEGLLGLGFSDISSHNFPTVLSNLKDKLRHPVFSLYLNEQDDYPPQDFEPDGGDSQGNESFGTARPTSASSEIVFGGVNQKHYENCLSWHDLGQFQLQDGETFKGFWDFKLDGVRIGGSELPSSSLAILDSGTSFLMGPADAVGILAKLENVICIDMSDPSASYEVECDDPAGFDAAVLDCNQPVFDLDFIADGTTYTLTRDDLVIEVPAKDGGDPICVLRLLGTFELDGWILGDVFLNRYYGYVHACCAKLLVSLRASFSQTLSL